MTDKVVQLNVGGMRYDVSRETLERCSGSMLARLVSDQWKEGNADDDEPIFIDRNGRLFEYVLDFLRNNEVHVPPSVSRAAVKEEFEYFGIAEGTKGDADIFENSFFQEKTEGIMAEINQQAAINAVKESAQVARSEQLQKQELVFFILLEYYKMIPYTEGSPIIIGIPEKYQEDCDSPWVEEELKKRGFEVHDSDHDNFEISKII